MDGVYTMMSYMIDQLGNISDTYTQVFSVWDAILPEFNNQTGAIQTWIVITSTPTQFTSSVTSRQGFAWGIKTNRQSIQWVKTWATKKKVRSHPAPYTCVYTDMDYSHAAFTDIAQTPYRQAIQQLINQCIIDTNQPTFRYNEYITLGEWVKIVTKSYYLSQWWRDISTTDLQSLQPYTIVWWREFDPYIVKALDLGLFDDIVTPNTYIINNQRLVSKKDIYTMLQKVYWSDTIPSIPNNSRLVTRGRIAKIMHDI
jgi:hypothetical protein